MLLPTPHQTCLLPCVPVIPVATDVLHSPSYCNYVSRSPAGTNLAGAAGLIHHFHSFFTIFGVPVMMVQNVLQVLKRLSSVSTSTRLHALCPFPSVQWQSRGDSKVSQALMSNTHQTGSLDHDRFLGAMLQLHMYNTSEPDCNISPAKIIFGRPQMRNTLLRQPPGEILKSKCMCTLVPRMGCQGASSLFTDLSHTFKSLKEQP